MFMTNPTPFNLEAAKAGEAIMFNGEVVAFGAHLPMAHKCCRIVVINRDGNLLQGQEDGTINGLGTLVMSPRTRRVTVKLYQHNGDLIALVDAKATWAEHEWTLVKEETWEIPV